MTHRLHPRHPFENKTSNFTTCYYTHMCMYLSWQNVLFVAIPTLQIVHSRNQYYCFDDIMTSTNQQFHIATYTTSPHISTSTHPHISKSKNPHILISANPYILILAYQQTHISSYHQWYCGYYTHQLTYLQTCRSAYLQIRISANQHIHKSTCQHNHNSARSQINILTCQQFCMFTYPHNSY